MEATILIEDLVAGADLTTRAPPRLALVLIMDRLELCPAQTITSEETEGVEVIATMEDTILTTTRWIKK